MSMEGRRLCTVSRWFVLLAVLIVGVSAAHAAPGRGRPNNAYRFKLFPNGPFVACLAAEPGVTPTVDAVVVRGELNDRLTLRLRGFKPGLNFDLFTVERSPQLADGTHDPNFHNFGLAWYQSDIHVGDRDDDDADDVSGVTIRTILLDQIFGFDPDVALTPTNTFHIGFWFNDPNDATACGFTGFTPFNGEHHAGPFAFITRPDANSGLGPLCTNPDLSTTPPHCNP
jgi:hypothetical protein